MSTLTSPLPAPKRLPLGPSPTETPIGAEPRWVDRVGTATAAATATWEPTRRRREEEEEERRLPGGREQGREAGGREEKGRRKGGTEESRWNKETRSWGWQGVQGRPVEGVWWHLDVELGARWPNCPA